VRRQKKSQYKETIEKKRGGVEQNLENAPEKDTWGENNTIKAWKEILLPKKEKLREVEKTN